MARRRDPMYEKRKELALIAFNSGCMIYASDTGKWYTPKEFVESDQVIDTKVYAMQEYSNIVLHYAKNALIVEQEKMRKKQIEYEAFMKRVLEAFELHPIGKDKQKK